jgi:hypothetical protein
MIRLRLALSSCRGYRNRRGNEPPSDHQRLSHGTYNGQEFYDDQRCSIVLGREKQDWQVLSKHCTQIVAPRILRSNQSFLRGLG